MKHQAADRKYKEDRSIFSDRMGSREVWSIIDQWPLYCGVGNLAHNLAIIDLLRQSFEVPGDVVEFGVWKGGNLMLLAKLLKIHDPHGSKVVHGFDSFQGLTEFSTQDGEAKQFSGAYQGALEELKEIIELYEMADDIVLHVGLIEETLPEFITANPAAGFSFVYCDTDLYQSTKLVLDQLHTRVAKGGLIVFDEWNNSEFPGEGIAVNEFLRDHGDSYEVLHVANTRQPNLYLRKTVG